MSSENSRSSGTGWGAVKRVKGKSPSTRGVWAALVMVLLLCGLSGWQKDPDDMGVAFWLIGAATLCVCASLLPLFWLPVRFFSVALIAAFAVLSGLLFDQERTYAGAWLLSLAHLLERFLFLLVLLTYGGLSVFRVMRRARREKQMDAEFMRLDIWFFNAGLVFFASVLFVRLMDSDALRDGLASPFLLIQALLLALGGALDALSVSILLLLGLKTSQSTTGCRSLAVFLLISALAFLALSFGRMELSRGNFHKAEKEFREIFDEKFTNP